MVITIQDISLMVQSRNEAGVGVESMVLPQTIFLVCWVNKIVFRDL